MEAYTQTGIQLATTYLPKVASAIVVLVVGLWLIGRIAWLADGIMERESTDETLRRFFGRLISIGLKVLLVISVTGMVGIETTSFIAVTGATGLAIGLALQGRLVNFAGGVLILLFRPYRVGDVIDAQGIVGSVREIQLFNTILTTPENKVAFVPNGAISNGIITNITLEELHRVDLTFGIGYQDDIVRAGSVLQGLIDADSRIHPDPEPPF